MKRLTIFLTVYIAWLQLRPFLKPNWLSLLLRKLSNRPRIQYSKTLDKIELIAIPRKSAQENDLELEAFPWKPTY